MSKEVNVKTWEREGRGRERKGRSRNARAGAEMQGQGREREDRGGNTMDRPSRWRRTLKMLGFTLAGARGN
jgi:hypothetical protein